MAAPPLLVPEFRIRIDDRPMPAAMRATVSGVVFQTGLEGADRVEVTLVNDDLRWLDEPLLALDRQLSLSLGYAPDLQQVFVGDVVGQAPAFPADSAPTLSVAAQDRRERLQEANRVRWFAVPVPTQGNYPLPDLAVAATISAEHGLIPMFDPIGAALSAILGGIDVAVGVGDPDERQKAIRKQVGESDYAFLQRIAANNGWDMLVDHRDPLGGSKLVFTSSLDHLQPDVSLKYGQSLIDFAPRLTRVGQIAGVSVVVWRPDIKLEFTVTAAWDWDRQALTLSISPGSGKQTGSDTLLLVDEPVPLAAAPRVIVSKLLPRLNNRLTGTGSTYGNPRITAGAVLRLEGLGQQFGGLYRVTSATHTFGEDGYRTRFDVRKEVWFGSIPLPEQGAIPVRPQGVRVAS